jgi:hypothetical protein
MTRTKFYPISITLLGLLLFPFLPVLPASPAAVEGEKASEVTIDETYPDTIRIIAENYAAKVDSYSKMISCVGPIKSRPDDGLIFLSTDTAIYFGLPSPETHDRASRMAAATNHIIVLRNLNEGFNASRMFDLSKFDAVILNAPEVGAALTPQDIMADLGGKVADFDLHTDAVPNKVVLLTAPEGGAVLKKVDAGPGLYKTVITFPNTSLAAAMYWLEDATWVLKAYNPRTNGKILTLNNPDDWKKMMSNENFAKDINVDKISAIVMPEEAPDSMIKSAAKAGVQRVIHYSFTEEEIASATADDPAKMMSTSNNISIFNCLYPDMLLFWYQT